MFVIWLISTQFFQPILYKFIVLGFLGWSSLIFGLPPNFGPYNNNKKEKKKEEDPALVSQSTCSKKRDLDQARGPA